MGAPRTTRVTTVRGKKCKSPGNTYCIDPNLRIFSQEESRTMPWGEAREKRYKEQWNSRGTTEAQEWFLRIFLLFSRTPPHHPPDAGCFVCCRLRNMYRGRLRVIGRKRSWDELLLASLHVVCRSIPLGMVKISWMLVFVQLLESDVVLGLVRFQGPFLVQLSPVSMKYVRVILHKRELGLGNNVYLNVLTFVATKRH